jgi:hypothetical protein
MECNLANKCKENCYVLSRRLFNRNSDRRLPRLAKSTLTPTLSRKKNGIIHPHLNPLPSRERKIRELVLHREREIKEGVC